MRASISLVILILISSYLNISLRNQLAQKEIIPDMDNHERLCHSKYAANYSICAATLKN